MYLSLPVELVAEKESERAAELVDVFIHRLKLLRLTPTQLQLAGAELVRQLRLQKVQTEQTQMSLVDRFH
jgi:hypothetical protein